VIRIRRAKRIRVKSIRKKGPHFCEQCDVVLPRGYRLCMLHYSQTVRYFHFREWMETQGAA